MYDGNYRGRILVAEDNSVNQRVAQLMLEQMGFTVDVVEDGIAAVVAASDCRYDAVLMDCQMPRMDGYDATAAIRQIEAGGGRIPIIALTASALESDRERCLAAGMDDHVAKPIRPEALARALSQFAPTDPARAEAGGDVPASAGPSPLDEASLQQLRTLSDGDTSLLRELYTLFVAETPERLGEMRDAAARHDGDTLFFVAHTMKGAADVLGATNVVTSCRRIIDRAHAGEFVGIASLIDDLERDTVIAADALVLAIDEERAAPR